jgi:hypothetical protein
MTTTTNTSSLPNSINGLVSPRPKLSNLSPEQLGAIKKLREMTSKFEYPEKDGTVGVFRLDDETLLRFLFARDFNVHRASQMLASHLKMRLKFRPHELRATDAGMELALGLNHDTAYWLQCGVVEVEGIKSTLEVIRVANYQPSKFENSEHYLRSILYLKELSTRLFIANGISSSILICDLAGWTLMSHGTPSATMQVRHLVDVIQNGYPETMRVTFILNTPSVFRWTWVSSNVNITNEKQNRKD